MCDGHNGFNGENEANPLDFTGLTAAGFNFRGRQSYTGEYVAQVYDMTEDAQSVKVSFTFTGDAALSTSSFSIWKIAGETVTMLAGSENTWAAGNQTFTTTQGLNTGDRLVLIWNSNNGGSAVSISNFSASYKKAVTATAETAGLQSGFYRIKYAGSDEGNLGKYLVAPENLPGEGAESGNNIALGGTAPMNSATHRDVWYVENLGLADGATGNGSTEERYKIWCFQGGYGIGANNPASVFGSYNKQYCPRLYRIMKVTKGDDVTYAFSGHPYDKNTSYNMGLAIDYGGIGTLDYIPSSLKREGGSDATAAAVQWAFEPLKPLLNLPINLMFGDTGYATFSSCATVEIPEAIKAYEVITTTSGYVQMNELSGIIPANAGVILKANPKETINFKATNGLGKGMKAVNADGTLGEVVDKNNKLVAAVNATTLSEGDFILAKNAEGEVVFGIIGASNDKNLAAGKAYLPAAAVPAAEGGANALSILWDNTETGISNITRPAILNGKRIENGRVVIVKNGLKYTLSGQRIK